MLHAAVVWNLSSDVACSRVPESARHRALSRRCLSVRARMCVCVTHRALQTPPILTILGHGGQPGQRLQDIQVLGGHKRGSTG